ncbi:hypothetical protein [Dyella mobilis]|uniref:Uncharacterized protein n=1 Tax=Dyella mobilis TaxID=1849582 RepID=A0ABS2KET3_9GAMM|nr:hypothetical protein [Dyella mobilis]MBM7129678.1 hypothetical protein [Dyella mobilis]GLQ98056.1 hypothetical protein GCM10007863_24760 [Dyella mobilis]
MKKLWILLVLFVSWPYAANASDIYSVHLQNSQQPYVCVQCDLRTPIPDQKTREILSAWQEGKAPFAASMAQSLKDGDRATVCNGCGCASYMLSHDGIWFDGDFKARKEYPADSSTAPSPKRAATSG